MSNREASHNHPKLSPADLFQLKRWNTPSIYNGWEQVTKRNPATEGFNEEETRDFMPQMGPMVGYAVTVTIEPSNPVPRKANPNAFLEYLSYVASVSGPKIIVVQDLDKPRTAGSFWGEVNSSIHRALGCVGTITDGAIRDLDEMTAAGFKALARRLCVGHAHVTAVRWGCEVEVFGRTVRPGDLIHADKHGFLAIAPDEHADLLKATQFMDANECATVIPAGCEDAGRSKEEILANIATAISQFGANLKAQLNTKGEW